ncbi:Alpha/Beta hydrolase protein [Flammula alnicola]|nr:Alpha/Beta hydrolase protein [Flammula alnicola]
MFAFTLLVLASVLLPVIALPAPDADFNNAAFPALNRPTALGTANGVVDPAGAYRFSVKYASASRWAPSNVVSAWNLPNGFTNVSSLPLACPQPNVDSSTYSEDCLSMVIYVPPTLTLSSDAPTLLWIHGGSFIIGSATGPGLDGSNLAIATNSIVAVVQYRLGALGFMAPSGQTNLALKDLKVFLHLVEALQKSPCWPKQWANMIRALLAVPSASSLFRSAILQSDPMNFGFLSTTTQNTLQTNFTGSLACGTDSNCLNSLSLDTILNAQMNLFNIAADLDPAAGLSEPIRPVLDHSFITAPLDSTGPFPSVSKPVLVTSVLQEAGFAIYGGFADPLPEPAFPMACNATFGPNRTAVVVSSPNYAPVTSLGGSVDARVQLQTVGTDYLWRCSGWTFARNWVHNGGTAYVGQFIVGATYPGNDAVPFCTQPGVVCHQDDIEIVFGTVPNATSAQSALTTEMQKRYKAFLTNGNPNAAGVPTWTPATGTDVHPLILGGSGEVAVGACDPNFWGSSVQYDYQFYDE